MKKSILDEVEKEQLERARADTRYWVRSIISHKKAIIKRLKQAKANGALYTTMRSGAHRVKLAEALATLEQQGVKVGKLDPGAWRGTNYKGTMANIGKVVIDIGFNNNGPVVCVKRDNDNAWREPKALEIKWSTKKMFVYNKSLDITLKGKD